MASLKECTKCQIKATAHYLWITHLHEDNYAASLRERGNGGSLSSLQGNHLDSIRLCFHFSNANAVAVVLTFSTHSSRFSQASSKDTSSLSGLTRGINGNLVCFFYDAV